LADQAELLNVGSQDMDRSARPPQHRGL
jgi:hypothetical protein